MAPILIVEDDFDIRTDIAEILREEQFGVQIAENGETAMHMLSDGLHPCLIVLDLMMPVMNGWQFRAEQLKNPGLARFPVVVMSGVADAASEANALGAAAYLKKPLDLEELLEIADRFCPRPPDTE